MRKAWMLFCSVTLFIRCAICNFTQKKLSKRRHRSPWDHHLFALLKCFHSQLNRKVTSHAIKRSDLLIFPLLINASEMCQDYVSAVCAMLTPEGWIRCELKWMNNNLSRCSTPFQRWKYENNWILVGPFTRWNFAKEKHSREKKTETCAAFELHNLRFLLLSVENHT